MINIIESYADAEEIEGNMERILSCLCKWTFMLTKDVQGLFTKPQDLIVYEGIFTVGLEAMLPLDQESAMEMKTFDTPTLPMYFNSAMTSTRSGPR